MSRNLEIAEVQAENPHENKGDLGEHLSCWSGALVHFSFRDDFTPTSSVLEKGLWYGSIKAAHEKQNKRHCNCKRGRSP